MTPQKLATLFHGDQMYGDQPYTYHLSQVAFPFMDISTLEAKDGYELEHTVGWLHDILEDTECTPTELEEAFGSEVLQVVQLLTKDPKLDYFQNIYRIIESGNLTAMRVKYADNASNYYAKGKPQNKEKYKKSMDMLLKAIKGT